MIKNKQLLLLLLWMAIAWMLRFANLDSKPLWTDEFSTLVFSLGNSFRGVPIDRAIALSSLVEPLQWSPTATTGDVLHNLLLESNHPPVYFMLAHWWMELFRPSADSLVWIGRSLPALLGVISVPAIYFLGKFAFNSPLVGQCAAAMMAVSPYGIYLAQEARHYTLGILLVIASLFCLILSIKRIQQRALIPLWTVAIWLMFNCLGIASHYFFVLTLCAEAIALTAVIAHSYNEKYPIFFKLENEFKKNHSPFGKSKNIWRLLAVASGTAAGGLIWVPIFFSNKYGSELTNWIVSGDRTWLNWISPIFQALAGWITVISLLPVESSNLAVVIASAIGMTIFFVWALPLVFGAIKTALKNPDTVLGTIIFCWFVVGAIFLFFSFKYILDIDLTRGARYNFVYFPGVILLLGAALAILFNTPTVKSQWFNYGAIETSGKKAVLLILLMGFVSGITVNSNLGYRKYYKPDLLVPIIREVSQVPVLIATTQKTHVEIGELMGIGWEIRKREQEPPPTPPKGGTSQNGAVGGKSEEPPPTPPKGGTSQNGAVGGKSEEPPPTPPKGGRNQNPTQGRKESFDSPLFLLVNVKRETPEIASGTLEKTLSQLQRPLDLWLVNFRVPVDLKAQGCEVESRKLPAVDGYEYQVYHCSS
ncbi:MAG: glycosyltransferase family 39 protein [Microcoleus sp.]